MKKNTERARAKSPTLNRLILRYIFFYGSYFFLLMSLSIVLIAFLLQTQDRVYLYVWLGTFVPLFLLFLVAVIVGWKRIYQDFYHSLFGVTNFNYSQLNARRGGLKDYPKHTAHEFDLLNDRVALIRSDFANSVLTTERLDYSGIPLLYLDQSHHLVSHHTFHNYLPALIQASPSFRNLLGEAYYDYPLSAEEKEHLFRTLKEAFSLDDGVLFSFLRDDTGLYFYLPQMTSIAYVKEKLSSVRASLGLLRQDSQGSSLLLPVHFVMVCYPYSLSEDLFPDIHYARQMGKEDNLYLPERTQLYSEDRILSTTSMNLNILSALFNELPSPFEIRETGLDVEKLSHEFDSLCSFLRIEKAAVLLNQESVLTYFEPVLTYGNYIRMPKNVQASLVSALEASEEGGSLYVRDYAHAPSSIRPVFDVMSVTGGFFCRMAVNGRTKALAYFVNRTRPLVLTSYLQECLFVFSKNLCSLFVTDEEREAAENRDRILQDLLKSNGEALYGIEKKTHRLIYLSEGMALLAPQAKKGQPCYEALYGLKTPCEDCPLVTRLAKKTVAKGREYETLLQISPQNEATVPLLLVPSDLSASRSWFDPQIFIPSFPSLSVALSQAYLTHQHGYLLLLKIDNLQDLLQQGGSADTWLALRDFGHVLSRHVGFSFVFRYVADGFALLLPFAGKVDVVNWAEKVYGYCQRTFFPRHPEFHFRITYLPLAYPSVYATSEDFLNHATVRYNDPTLETGHELILFEQESYSRPASKRRFMLIAFDKAMKDHTYRLFFQPIVRTSDGKIDGVEALLRIRDEYRDFTFQPAEIVEVVQKNDRAGLLMSHLLSDFGNLYLRYGQKGMGGTELKHFSLNADAKFLEQPAFVALVKEALKQYHVPKGMLVLDFPEEDFDGLSDAATRTLGDLKKAGVLLALDHYTGKILSPEKAGQLGFDEVKVHRPLVENVDVDRTAYNTISSIDAAFKKVGITVGFIGVEKLSQYQKIAEIDKDSYLQGYYFSAPLALEDFLSYLRDRKPL